MPQENVPEEIGRLFAFAEGKSKRVAQELQARKDALDKARRAEPWLGYGNISEDQRGEFLERQERKEALRKRELEEQRNAQVLVPAGKSFVTPHLDKDKLTMLERRKAKEGKEAREHARREKKKEDRAKGREALLSSRTPGSPGAGELDFLERQEVEEQRRRQALETQRLNPAWKQQKPVYRNKETVPKNKALYGGRAGINSPSSSALAETTKIVEQPADLEGESEEDDSLDALLDTTDDEQGEDEGDISDDGGGSDTSSVSL